MDYSCLSNDELINMYYKEVAEKQEKNILQMVLKILINSLDIWAPYKQL